MVTSSLLADTVIFMVLDIRNSDEFSSAKAPLDISYSVGYGAGSFICFGTVFDFIDVGHCFHIAHEYMRICYVIKFYNEGCGKNCAPVPPRFLTYKFYSA